MKTIERQFAKISKVIFCLRPIEYKKVKGLKLKNLCDHMAETELIFCYICILKFCGMLTKTSVIMTISTFPDNFTLDELIDKLIFMDKVERGLEQSLANNVLSEEEAKKRLSKWLK